MAMRLELKSTKKRFGPTLALDEADCDLQSGEAHALFGENGAGKSTALDLIYGVSTPNEGEVYIDAAAPSGSLQFPSLNPTALAASSKNWVSRKVSALLRTSLLVERHDARA